jgi:hypothetical protein
LYGNQKGILNRNHRDGIIFLPIEQPRGSKFGIPQKHPPNAKQTTIQSAFQTHAKPAIQTHAKPTIKPKSIQNSKSANTFKLPLPHLFPTKWHAKPNHI